MDKNKIFAVFGLGTFGYQVCKVMSEKGAKVIAFDKQEKLIDKIKDDVTQAVLIDSTDEEALRNAGVTDIDVAIVSIGDNKEASILTTALLKNLNVPYIIARALSDIHAQVLKQVGANEVIILEIEEGKRLANHLLAPDVLDIISVSKNQSIAEIRVSNNFKGKTLPQLALRKKFNINVISIKRTTMVIDDAGNPVQEEIVLNPEPEEILQQDDIIVVLGREKDIEKLKGDLI